MVIIKLNFVFIKKIKLNFVFIKKEREWKVKQ